MKESPTPRLVIVGRNSKVWKALRQHFSFDTLIEESHASVAGLRLMPDDRVWIFAFSRVDEENEALVRGLKEAGAKQVWYVSTATANVAEQTGCYSYPRAKKAAEGMAAAILGAQIVRFGLVYRDEDQIPSGISATTSLASIYQALHASLGVAPEVPTNLFERHEQEFSNSIEKVAYRLYGAVIARLPNPCLLRPVDLLLRLLGWKWYGYVYLSNRSWFSTTR